MTSQPLHSASEGTTVLVTSIAFLVLAVLSVIFRLIARIILLKNAGSDDVAMVFALVCFLPCFDAGNKS